MPCTVICRRILHLRTVLIGISFFERVKGVEMILFLNLQCDSQTIWTKQSKESNIEFAKTISINECFKSDCKRNSELSEIG